MKYFIRYVIGTVLGAGAAMLLPVTPEVSQILEALTDITLRLGRFLAVPLIFFSFAIAVTKLRRIKDLGGTLIRGGVTVLITSGAAVFMGTLFNLTIEPRQLPVISAEKPPADMPQLLEILRHILEPNLFRVFIGDPSFLLPLCALGFLLGWHFYHDREVAEPSFNFFDSLSRILYRAQSYFLRIMPLLLAVLTARTIHTMKTVIDFSYYLPLLGLMTLGILILVGGLYPVILLIARGRPLPWSDLSKMGAILWGAFVSGSPLFNYGNMVVHLKENLNIPRKSAAVTAPLALMFARAGTAMISTIGMLTVIHSYSSLEITLFQAFWTSLFAFLVSFALPAIPDKGVLTSLVMLCSLYSRGLEDGWLVLVPILPLLTILAVLGDTATAVLVTLLAVDKKEKKEKTRLRLPGTKVKSNSRHNPKKKPVLEGNPGNPEIG